MVLGGDHSLSMPVLAALAGRFGPDGYSVIHFDTHADTGDDEGEAPHGMPFTSAVSDGYLRRLKHRPDRAARQLAVPGGVRVDAGRGFRWRTMSEVVERGIAAVVERGDRVRSLAAPRTYLTVDIDVLDPAFAPGTGTAEPGGL